CGWGSQMRARSGSAPDGRARAERGALIQAPAAIGTTRPSCDANRARLDAAKASLVVTSTVLMRLLSRRRAVVARMSYGPYMLRSNIQHDLRRDVGPGDDS